MMWGRMSSCAPTGSRRSLARNNTSWPIHNRLHLNQPPHRILPTFYRSSVKEAVLAASLDLLPASTLLIVVRGMILAHSLPVCLLLSPATINQDIKGLRFDSKCNPQFMLVWLQGMAHILHSLIEESAHGTRCLRTDLLKNVVIHLPPIEEQAEIVSALNTHLARLDEAARPI